MKKLIAEIELSLIDSIHAINDFLAQAYEKTGQKFSVNFNGSKGYLHNVEITCEGKQSTDFNNRVYHPEFSDTINKTLRVYYDKQKGVKVELILK